MSDPEPSEGVWPWVVRAILALAALAAPIIVYKGLSESDSADPAKQQRLREASRNAASPAPTTSPRP